MEDPPQDENQTDAPAQGSWQNELERLELLDAARLRLWRDEFRRLHLLVDGETEHVDLRPAPVFPVSGVAEYMSFVDDKGRELVLLRDPGELDPESRQVLTEELSRTYFVPRITCIYEIDDAHGSARWEVDTDRGYRVFDVRDREDVRVLASGRILLQDVDGNRFEIADLDELDERSRRLLDGEI